MVLLTGYQAFGTRGRMIMEKQKMIPFYEQEGEIPLNARVEKMGGLSGHADCKETIAHLKNFHDPAKGEQFEGIYIKHGEKSACYALKKQIIAAGFDPKTVHVMKKGQEYVLK